MTRYAAKIRACSILDGLNPVGLVLCKAGLVSDVASMVMANASARDADLRSQAMHVAVVKGLVRIC